MDKIEKNWQMYKDFLGEVREEVERHLEHTTPSPLTESKMKDIEKSLSTLHEEQENLVRWKVFAYVSSFLFALAAGAYGYITMASANRFTAKDGEYLENRITTLETDSKMLLERVHSIDKNVSTILTIFEQNDITSNK